MATRKDLQGSNSGIPCAWSLLLFSILVRFGNRSFAGTLTLSAPIEGELFVLIFNVWKKAIAIAIWGFIHIILDKLTMRGAMKGVLLYGRNIRKDVLRHIVLASPMTRPTANLRSLSTLPAAAPDEEGDSSIRDHRLLGADDAISFAEAKKLVRLADMESLKARLESKGKEVICYSDLLKECESMGVARSTYEAALFARVLDEAGAVLLFRDKVHLYPDKVVDLVRRSVPLSLTEEDDSRRKELKKLQEIKDEIDMLARKQVRHILWSGMGMAVLHVGLFFRLTFWDFSWDVMEPIAFFSASTGIILGYAYFLFTAKDPTYEDLMHRLFLSRRQKLYKKHSFDASRFKELQKKHILPLDQISSK